jgi:hypothetical protein
VILPEGKKIQIINFRSIKLRVRYLEKFHNEVSLDQFALEENEEEISCSERASSAMLK